jgi:hypothetical protein
MQPTGDSRQPTARSRALLVSRLVPAFVGVLSGILSLSGCGPTNEPDVCKGRVVGDLVITEIMADPEGADSGNEYIELYNQLGTDIDLKGFTIYWKKPDGTGLKSHLIRAGKVPARGYFTLGDVRDGPLPSWIGYSYEDALGGLPQDGATVGIKCKELLLDETSYTTTQAEHSRTFDGNLPPDSQGNDNELKWCAAPEDLGAYSGKNYGSPAAPNPGCPLNVPAGNCLESGLTRAVVPPAPGDLLITEVMPDPKLWPDTDGEWIEVRSNADVDLNGLYLSNGTSRSQLTSVDCMHVAPGGYAVFASGVDAGVTAMATFSFQLGNGGGTVTIGTSDAGYDSLTYLAATSGASWQLDPTKLDQFSNDDPANLCKGTVPVFAGTDGGDLGTPGTPNTACTPVTSGTTCIDPGTGTSRNIVSPVVGDLVITEFMADPSAVLDTSGEWFEVYVAGSVDLNGVVLAGASGTPVTVVNTQCLRPDAGSHVVFARNADPAVNGALPPVMGTFGWTLANTSGTITLSIDGGTLDTVSYSTTQGAGLSTQLDVNKYDVLMNDQAANLCRTDAGSFGTLPDGGAADKGTPGARNHACL